LYNFKLKVGGEGTETNNQTHKPVARRMFFPGSSSLVPGTFPGEGGGGGARGWESGKGEGEGRVEGERSTVGYPT
jgi:hypothetical protein